MIRVGINRDGYRFPISLRFSALAVEDEADGEISLSMSVADARALADRIVEAAECASRARPLTPAETIREVTGVTAVDQ